MASRIVDNYQFHQETGRFVFHHYGHFVVVLLIIPVAVYFGLMSSYKVTSFSVVALLAFTLGLKERIIFDFDRRVVLRQVWFVNKIIINQSPPIALADDAQLQVEEERDEDGSQYWIAVYCTSKGKFIRVVYFLRPETAERIKELIMDSLHPLAAAGSE